MESKNYIKSVIKDIQNMSLEELRTEGVLIFNLFPTNEVKEAIKKRYLEEKDAKNVLGLLSKL